MLFNFDLNICFGSTVLINRLHHASKFEGIHGQSEPHISDVEHHPPGVLQIRLQDHTREGPAGVVRGDICLRQPCAFTDLELCGPEQRRDWMERWTGFSGSRSQTSPSGCREVWVHNRDGVCGTQTNGANRWPVCWRSVHLLDYHGEN